MDGMDYLLAGMGVAFVSWVTTKGILNIYRERGLTRQVEARYNSFIELVRTYGERISPEELIKYARSLGLVDKKK